MSAGGGVARAMALSNGRKNTRSAGEKRGGGAAQRGFHSSRSGGRPAGTGAGAGSGSGSTGTGKRDTFLSSFHALGKLLYAKRLSSAVGTVSAVENGRGGGGGGEGGAGGAEGRGALAFVPEEVLSQGGMEVDSAVAFLQYHCVDFYTDEHGKPLRRILTPLPPRTSAMHEFRVHSSPENDNGVIRLVLVVVQFYFRFSLVLGVGWQRHCSTGISLTT